MLSFFIHQIFEATISHSFLIFKEKIPLRSFSVPSHLLAAGFCLCVTGSVQNQVSSENNVLAFAKTFRSVILDGILNLSN